MSTLEMNGGNDEYVTVSQLSKLFPCFSEGSIRWLIFNAETNGFDPVIRRIGRKIILNLAEFKKYLAEQRTGNTVHNGQ